jgi:hypothetical protein
MKEVLLFFMILGLIQISNSIREVAHEIRDFRQPTCEAMP